MKKHVNAIMRHPLVAGSSLVFIGTLIVNVVNYVFNLVMGRLLPIDQYGLLVSLTSFVSIIGIFQTSLIQLFAKFSAKYSAQKDFRLKKALFKSGLKITIGLSIAFFIGLMIVIVPFSKFLHVDNYLILTLTFLSSSLIILTSLPLGILQGELRFLSVSFINVSIVVSRIILGVSLVMLGFGATGAMLALTVSFLFSYIFSFYYQRNYKKIKSTVSKPHFFNEFKKISLPFLVASLGVNLIQSTDVIFVRHFLSQTDAGLFAALSLMGKAIFYITSPIFFAFFPLIAQKNEKKEGTFSTLLLAFGIVLGCNLFFSALYTFFPSFIISFFFPQKEYQALAPYLGLYAIYILVYSIGFLLYNYYLSLGKTQIYKISLAITVTYVGLIFCFHKSIQDFVFILIFSSFLLLLFLLVYYIKFSASK